VYNFPFEQIPPQYSGKNRKLAPSLTANDPKSRASSKAFLIVAFGLVCKQEIFKILFH
jgi:hypothetical protein